MSEEFNERSNDIDSAIDNTYQMTNNVNLSLKRRRSTSSYVDSTLQNSYSQMNSYAIKDECSAFSEYVEAILRKFDDKRRSFVIHQISQVIFEAEVQMYNTSDSDQNGIVTNGDFQSTTHLEPSLLRRNYKKVRSIRSNSLPNELSDRSGVRLQPNLFQD